MENGKLYIYIIVKSVNWIYIFKILIKKVFLDFVKKEKKIYSNLLIGIYVFFLNVVYILCRFGLILIVKEFLLELDLMLLMGFEFLFVLFFLMINVKRM